MTNVSESPAIPKKEPAIAVGRRFGRLVVLARGFAKTERSVLRASWFCRCDCGKDHTAFGNNLVRGVTRSCGCGIAIARRERTARRAAVTA